MCCRNTVQLAPKDETAFNVYVVQRVIVLNVCRCEIIVYGNNDDVWASVAEISEAGI
jgi:hypothetical protein